MLEQIDLNTNKTIYDHWQQQMVNFQLDKYSNERDSCATPDYSVITKDLHK